MLQFYNPKFDWLLKCMYDFWVSSLTFFPPFTAPQSPIFPLSVPSNSSLQQVAAPAGIDY